MMKHLHLITPKKQHTTTVGVLKASAEKRSINIHIIDPDEFDFAHIPRLTKKDGLYRVGIDKKSRLVEQLLVNKHAAIFYTDYTHCVGGVGNTIAGDALFHWKQGLPIIKTVFSVTNNRQQLKAYVEYLGGFPVIIKSMGGSRGIGVMKIDSYESLFSIVDFLATTNSHFILRAYVDYVEHARLVVVGNKVVASMQYKRVPGDFRSNVGKQFVSQPKKYGKDINKLAVRSVTVLGREFGGVDILIDKKKQAHLAEVNTPCYFPSAQEKTGIEISGIMLDHLIAKSKRL